MSKRKTTKLGTIIPFANQPVASVDESTTFNETAFLDIAYSETPSKAVCIINIHGAQIARPVVIIPSTGHHAVIFDPLSKLWACLRRRISELWSLSIAGVFTYDTDQEVISCHFYPNTAGVDDSDKYLTTFAESFPEWAKFFEQHLENWLTATDGYTAYVTMVKAGELDSEKYRQLFNRYLKAHNLRTRADEARSAAKRRRQAEASAN